MNTHQTLHDAPSPTGTEVIIGLEARVADWEIAPGRTLRGFTYNGQVPGPTIEARVGDTVVVRLAGTFWYHSHFNETVQLEKGLYGALVVREAEELPVDREQVLVLDDVKLNRKGDFAKFGGWMEEHMGREGKTRLLNGRVEPELAIVAGQVERWRVVNASSARYIRLSIGGSSFSILGNGGGFIEEPVTATEYLLAPGNRVDIAVGPFREGDTISVDSLPYDRHTGKKSPERFATVRVGPAEFSRAVIPGRLRSIEPLAGPEAVPTRSVKMSERLSIRRGTDFMINDERHHNDAPVTVGDLQIWDIMNASHMDHPFHLHGFFFQVLAINGVAPAFRSWEDTVNVPPRGRVLIAWMPDDRPGTWMYHCHILEHHAGGMMANFAVVRPGDPVGAIAVSACHD